MTQDYFKAKSVVLTSGTFLGGRIHIGLQNYTGGRAGDPASIRLSERLRDYELPVGRLKTGTPPRIDGRTIDFSVLEEQPGIVQRQYFHLWVNVKIIHSKFHAG